MRIKTKTKVPMPDTAYASADDADAAIMEDIHRRLAAPDLTEMEKIKLRALRTVNYIRISAGFEALVEMPTGGVGDSYDCPIYRALAPLGVEDVSGGSLTFNRMIDIKGKQVAPADLIAGIGPALNGAGEINVLDEWRVDPEEGDSYYGDYPEDRNGYMSIGDEFEAFISKFDAQESWEMQLLNDSLDDAQRQELAEAEGKLKAVLDEEACAMKLVAA